MSRYYKRYFSDETTEKIKEVLAGAGIDICNDAVESELYRMIQDGTKYSERCFTLQRMFKPTDEDFQRIIRMNDVLHERFTEAWNQMLEMKRQLDSDMQEGRLDISGYFMRAEFYFCYNYSQLGVPTADGESLMRFSDAADIMFPQMELTRDSKIPDLEKDILCYNPEKSWNVGWFDYPQLKGHYLYKYMHSLFEESLAFCPMDIRYIKPEDLEWQIDVDYEYYSKEQHKVDPKYKTNLPVTEHIKTYPWNYIPFYGHGYDYWEAEFYKWKGIKRNYYEKFKKF